MAMLTIESYISEHSMYLLKEFVIKMTNPETPGIFSQTMDLSELCFYMRSFFQISFQIIGRKHKSIQTAWMLTEVQCINMPSP